MRKLHALVALVVFGCFVVVTPAAPVHAAALDPDDNQTGNCAVTNLATTSTPRMAVACYLNPSPSPSTVFTTMYSSYSPGTYDVTTTSYVPTNHATGTPSRQYYDNCTGSDIPATLYVGAVDTPIGDIPEWSMLMIWNSHWSCDASPYLGVSSAVNCGTSYETDDDRLGFSGFGVWAGGDIAGPGQWSTGASCSWGIDSAPRFPSLYYVEEYVEVVPACAGLEPADFARNGGAELADLESVPPLSNGDTLSFELGHESALVPLSSDVTLDYRWSSNQAWAPLYERSSTEVWVDPRLSVSRAGASVQAQWLELRCVDAYGDWFWRWDTGWEDFSTTDVCAEYSVTIEYRPLDTDPYIDQSVTWLGDPEIVPPGGFQVTIDHPNTPAGVANFAIMWGSGGSGVLFASIIAGTTSLPLVEEIEAPEFGVDYRDVRIRCTSADGSDPSEWDGDGFVPVDPGDGNEACFTFSGLSLTSPGTWLRAAGQMGICVAEWLLVPSTSSMVEFLEDAEDLARGNFPFSLLVVLVEFMDDTADAVTSSSGCIDIGIDDIEGASVPCMEVPAGPFGAERDTVATIVVGLFILSLAASCVSLVTDR